MTVANRLYNTQEYYFSKKLKEVEKLRLEGQPILNLGIGSPDLLPPPNVIKTLQNYATEPTANKYQSYIGLPNLRQEIANFYQKWYGVLLNPNKEILPLMGSKEGILHISMAFLNKGDKVLLPNPGYPTYSAVTKLVEAIPIYYDLLEKNNYQINFEALEKEDLSNVKIMWVNYPHMPTGTLTDSNTFSKLIEFGEKHNLLVINDNPYSFILNNNPQSILSVSPKANKHLLELNSLSKTFNMAGWRLGTLCGHSENISHVLKVKSNMDSGMYFPIQMGAIQALQTEKIWIDQQNHIYKKRQNIVFAIMDKLDCNYNPNAVGMFVWGKLNSEVSSETFVDKILYEKNIFITPGTIFGTNGEGYIRISLCLKDQDIKEALNRLS